jgi:hypothetical protein
MRLVTTTLLVCSLSTLGALAQDPPASPDNPDLQAVETTSTEESPAPAQEARSEAAPETSSLLLSDQEFLQIPGDSDRPAEPSLFDSDTSLTGEMPFATESDEDYIDPNGLLPDLAGEIPTFDPRTAAMAGDELERKLKVRYREVRTKAERDAAVASLLEQAQSARTFEAERAAYREYYRALFRKMRQLDKSLAKKCDLMEKAYLDRLAQTRIEPTIPLQPPPKPEPLANN